MTIHSQSTGKPGLYPSPHDGRHEQEAAHAAALNSVRGLGLPYPMHPLSQQPPPPPSHHLWSGSAAASHAQLMANQAMAAYASSLQGHISSSLM